MFHWWIVSILPILTTVACHGTVSQITLVNKTYAGPIPLQDGVPASRQKSIIRQILYGSPILNTSDPDNACGKGSMLASDVAQTLPGDAVGVEWRGEDGISHWPHDTGPIFAYLTSCGNISCTKFNASGAQWFKVAQAGQSDKRWAQVNLTLGQPFAFKIPFNLEAGQYLLRNEVVNMGQASGGIVELYVACGQLQVGGNGTARPQASDLVQFPGAYNQSDFLNIDPYDPTQKYVMPGPPIASLVNASMLGNQTTTANATSLSNVTLPVNATMPVLANTTVIANNTIQINSTTPVNLTSY